MSAIAAAIIVAAAVLWAGRELLAEVRAARDDVARTRALSVLQMFAAGIAATRANPRELLTWQPRLQ